MGAPETHRIEPIDLTTDHVLDKIDELANLLTQIGIAVSRIEDVVRALKQDAPDRGEEVSGG